MFDRMFGSGGMMPGYTDADEAAVGSLGLDVTETGDGFNVRAAVPGIDPKEIDITVSDDVLTIRGEFKEESDAPGGQWLRRELRYGSFERSIRLPQAADLQQAKATFNNGILNLSVPKKPESRPHKIEIAGNGQKQLLESGR